MALYTLRTAAVALTASSTKSLWLVNPAGPRVRLVEMGISMDGSTAAAGLAFELYRVNTLGTPAGTTATINKYYSGDGTASTTGLHTLTTEPTSVDPFEEWYLSPFGGMLVKQWPLGREPIMAAAGARMGLRYISGTSPPNCRTYVIFEE